MARPHDALDTPWPLICIGLLALSLLGIVGSLAMLSQVGVEGGFAISALSFGALVVGIAGLQWWAVLAVMRSSLPPAERILYLGLIFLLVPVGAILYYWLRVRSATSPQSSPRD